MNVPAVNFFKTALLLAAMTALFMGVGYLLGGYQGALIALAAAAATNLWAWWGSDKAVLRMHGAVRVDERTAPELVSMVRQLADNAGLPMPAVYIIETDQPNAFATGRSPSNAAVAASRGLLDRLSREEVAAVMAHELAHIENRDTLIMTITATLAGAIGFLGSFALFFRNNRSPFGALGYIVALFVAPLAATIVQMAISRTREYAADRRGAEICGNPSWLAGALRKIAAAAGRIVNVPAERQPASAHLFIHNPLSGARMDNLFSTHPDTGNRIRALQEMQAEIAQTSMPRLERQQEGAREVPGGHVPGASDAGTQLWGRETRAAPPVAPGSEDAPEPVEVSTRSSPWRPRGPWAKRGGKREAKRSTSAPKTRRSPWSARDAARDEAAAEPEQIAEPERPDDATAPRNPWKRLRRRASSDRTSSGRRNPWR